MIWRSDRTPTGLSPGDLAAPILGAGVIVDPLDREPLACRLPGAAQYLVSPARAAKCPVWQIVLVFQRPLSPLAASSSLTNAQCACVLRLCQERQLLAEISSESTGQDTRWAGSFAYSLPSRRQQLGRTLDIDRLR
jgi:hypothetical protein